MEGWSNGWIDKESRYNRSRLLHRSVIGYTNGLGGYLDKATYERLSKDQRRQWYDRGYFDRHLGIESNASPR